MLILSILAATGSLVTEALAQHEGHHPDDATPAASQAPPADKISDKMMMAEHAEVAKLVDQLAKSFAGIENEKDPAALEARLAEHGKLLKALQAKVQGHEQMMEHMHQHMHEMMGEHAKH